MRALDEWDDVLECSPVDVDPRRSLLRNSADTMSWSVETYDDYRDALIGRLCLKWTPEGQLSSRFQGSQPLSLSQVKRIDHNIDGFGLRLRESLVSRAEPTIKLCFSQDEELIDNYLGPVRVWRNDHQWMRFYRLDECSGLTASFTIAYRFTDNKDEEWTRRFNQLKNGYRHAVDGATRLLTGALRDLVQRLDIRPEETAIVPCLGATETSASPTGTVSSMARSCAVRSGIHFIDGAVTKQPHSPLSSLRSADERRQTVAGAHYSAARLDVRHVIILDDFITRGDTLSAVAVAIRRTSDVDSIYGVALGKNENAGYLGRNYGLNEVSNSHVSPDWLTQWPVS